MEGFRRPSVAPALEVEGSRIIGWRWELINEKLVYIICVYIYIYIYIFVFLNIFVFNILQ